MFDDLHEAAYHDAEKGRPVPGLKLVVGRAPARDWKDPDKAEVILKHDFKDEAFTKKMLSPAAVEDKVGKKEFTIRFKRLVKEGERKNVLVPETDRREAVKTYVDDFTDDMHSDDETAIV